MALTIEEVIKKEKALSGFIPFVEIAIALEQLSFNHQIAFFCSCGERILPTYMLLDGDDRWGDISILRSVLDELWQIAGGMLLSEDEIEALNHRVYEVFIEDEEEGESDHCIRGSLYDYWGEIVPQYMSLVLNYIGSHQVEVYCSIFTKIVYIVYEYYDMYLPDIDPEWEFKRYAEQASIVMNTILLQTELSKELADLQFLKNTPELSREILSTFRANACPNGVGILGSLDEIRATLDWG
ncbi:MAG: YjaG family protein [Cyanosarcina radialis HA8281-LM2]|jgi:hypothetical protein|nr:YjaG family protein [Cyanosarcina radialis HA8281-LM2]